MSDALDRSERVRVHPLVEIILLDDIFQSLEQLNKKTYGAFPAGAKFEEPYQYATVKAGETKTVYTRRITGGYVGFITQLSVSWYASTYIDWICDGVLLERLLRAIPFTTPKEFDPPIKVKKKIDFIAYNGDTSDHSFGVLCDGFLKGKGSIDV